MVSIREARLAPTRDMAIAAAAATAAKLSPSATGGRKGAKRGIRYWWAQRQLAAANTAAGVRRGATTLTVSGVSIMLHSRSQSPSAAPVSQPTSLPASLMSRRAPRASHGAQNGNSSTGRLRGRSQAAEYLQRRATRQGAPRKQGSQLPADAVGLDVEEGLWEESYCALQQWGCEVQVTMPVAGAPDPVQDAMASQSTGGSLAFVIKAVNSGGQGASTGWAGTSDVLAGNLSPGEISTQTMPAMQACQGNSGVASPHQVVHRLRFHVSVTLKSFMPEFTPQSALVGLRIVDRMLTYSKYVQFWKRRPASTVSQAPSTWWQHAGHAVVSECRSRYPVRKLSLSLSLRRQYISLYRALHSSQPYFTPTGTYRPPAHTTKGKGCMNLSPCIALCHPLLPNNMWTSSMLLAARVIQHRLQELELKLTLAQAMCYRTFVALQHSRCKVSGIVQPVLTKRAGACTTFTAWS